MITTSLAFEKVRKTGRLPQVALQLNLLSRVVIFAQDGIELLETVARKYDGSWQYDGTVQYGSADIVDLYHGVTSVSVLTEGDEGPPGSIEIQPARRSTFSVTIQNPTGRLSELVASDPLVGANTKLILTYPEITPSARLNDRFKGEVNRITLNMKELIVEARSG